MSIKGSVALLVAVSQLVVSFLVRYSWPRTFHSIAASLKCAPEWAQVGALVQSSWLTFHSSGLARKAVQATELNLWTYEESVQ